MGRLVPNDDGYGNHIYREVDFRDGGYRQQQQWQPNQVGPSRIDPPGMGSVFMNRCPPPGPRPAPPPGQCMPHPHT